MESRNLQYTYKKIFKLWNISYLKIHCLHHTVAIRYLTNGWDVKTLRKVLGHSNIKIIMDYYFRSFY